MYAFKKKMLVFTYVITLSRQTVNIKQEHYNKL